MAKGQILLIKNFIIPIKQTLLSFSKKYFKKGVRFNTKVINFGIRLKNNKFKSKKIKKKINLETI